MSGEVVPTIRVLGPADEADAHGTVVVLDVIRAFSTAAQALAAGATSLWCVESLAGARALAHATPRSVLAGEDGALPPPDFELGNSPSDCTPATVGGRVVVFRTSNGTRGLARATRAEHLLAGAATTVAATARVVTSFSPTHVDIVCTDVDHGEDVSVAQHLAALLRGEQPDPGALAEAVRAGGRAHFARWAHEKPLDVQAGFRGDVEACAAVDRHPFALVATRRRDHVELRQVTP